MFTRLSFLLPASLRRLGVERQVAARRVLEETNRFFENILGKESGLRAVRYSHGVILIDVRHPGAAQVAQQQQAALLEYLREACPQERIEGLRFRGRPLG